MPLIPRAPRRTAQAALVLLLATLTATLTATGLAACGGSPGGGASPTPATTASAPWSSPADGAAAGSRPAPGLYDLEDGSVVAVGAVEYRDLEGGFWAVVGGTATEGDDGRVVAVVVNGEDFADQFRENPGRSFEVYGERAGEASVRMAGPEITADRVVLAAEGGPAE